MLVLALAVGLSLLAAWLLYRSVERPAMIWAARIRYAPSQDSALTGARS